VSGTQAIGASKPEKSSTKSTLKTWIKSDPGFAIGHAYDREVLRENFRTNAKFWNAAALIGPNDPPVNILGGFKFPNAPVVDLNPIPPKTSGQWWVFNGATGFRSAVIPHGCSRNPNRSLSFSDANPIIRFGRRSHERRWRDDPAPSRQQARFAASILAAMNFGLAPGSPRARPATNICRCRPDQRLSPRTPAPKTESKKIDFNDEIPW